MDAISHISNQELLNYVNVSYGNARPMANEGEGLKRGTESGNGKRKRKRNPEMAMNMRIHD